MKSELNFWRSLEKYSWRVVGRAPLSWPWIGVLVVMTALVVSLLNGKNNLVGAKNTREAIEMAASKGDYETARELFNHKSQMTNSQMVLGIESELEDKVYPEKNVEKRIAELESKLDQYPGNREIYLSLGNLYSQLGNREASDEYRESARVLDPNGVKF